MSTSDDIDKRHLLSKSKLFDNVVPPAAAPPPKNENTFALF